MERENNPSVAMDLIKDYKRDIRRLMILNIITLAVLVFSIYDSIKVREDNVCKNTVEIIETIKSVCGDEDDQA